ncbi:hypothetical protein [uncultured Roseobacter sp.]|uniref:hypothetical protein n=1 Tax=uncultured Roseobacter sp. TaxID=114847 RepID=UPI002622CFA5|nr:hypothetical protein [uncultured Roseobacter sp.]
MVPKAGPEAAENKRQDRLKNALKQNLARRKQQARARSAEQSKDAGRSDPTEPEKDA